MPYTSLDRQLYRLLIGAQAGLQQLLQIGFSGSECRYRSLKSLALAGVQLECPKAVFEIKAVDHHPLRLENADALVMSIPQPYKIPASVRNNPLRSLVTTVNSYWPECGCNCSCTGSRRNRVAILKC